MKNKNKLLLLKCIFIINLGEIYYIGSLIILKFINLFYLKCLMVSLVLSCF